MSQKGFANTRIILIIILAVAAGFSYYALVKKSKPPISWKTYRHDQYGFEVKYPDAEPWKIEIEDHSRLSPIGGILRISLINEAHIIVKLNVFDIKSRDFSFYAVPEVAAGPDFIYRQANDRFYTEFSSPIINGVSTCCEPTGNGISEDELLNELQYLTVLRNPDGLPIFTGADADGNCTGHYYLLLGRQKGVALQVDGSLCYKFGDDAKAYNTTYVEPLIEVLQQVGQSLRFVN